MTDIDWLDELEERVGAATEEIDRLRRENERLRGRLEEGDEGDAEGWAEEREEVRDRVAELVERLEDLLPDD